MKIIVGEGRPWKVREGYTGAIVERTIGSVAGLLSAVKRLREEWKPELDLWFRGQADISDDLVPGFYRHPSLKGEEGGIRYTFQQAGRQLLNKEPRNKWEWYFLMQHHGVPTRLLDWSDGALLALHFALREHSPKDKDRPAEPDAAVWVLDPVWLHNLVNPKATLLPDAEDPENTRAKTLLDRYLSDRLYARARWPPLPIPLKPPHISPRIAAQQSCFTLHGGDPAGFKRTTRRSNRPRLARIRVLRGTIPAILEDLDEAGIVESSLFPDLDGLGRDIRSQFANTSIGPPPTEWTHRTSGKKAK